MPEPSASATTARSWARPCPGRPRGRRAAAQAGRRAGSRRPRRGELPGALDPRPHGSVQPAAGLVDEVGRVASSVRSTTSAVTTTTRTTDGAAQAAATVSTAIARTSRSRAPGESTPASRVFPSAAELHRHHHDPSHGRILPHRGATRSAGAHHLAELARGRAVHARRRRRRSRRDEPEQRAEHPPRQDERGRPDLVREALQAERPDDERAQRDAGEHPGDGRPSTGPTAWRAPAARRTDAADPGRAAAGARDDGRRHRRPPRAPPRRCRVPRAPSRPRGASGRTRRRSAPTAPHRARPSAW